MRQRIAWLLAVRSQDEDEQRRGSMVVVVALGLIVTSVLLFPLTLQSTASISGRIVLVGSSLIELGVFFLARSGRVTLGAFTLILVILAGTVGPMIANHTVSFSIFYLALTLLIASLTLRPRQIWLVLLANLLVVAVFVSALPQTVWADQASAGMLVGGVIFLGIVGLISFLGANGMARVLRTVRQAQTQLEASAASLAQSNADLEQRIAERTAALQTALLEVQTQAEDQARLLAENEQQRTTIREMSVPVIPVSDTTMIVPLVGALDSGRLAQLCTQALQAIERTVTRYLILDITGVVIVDSQVAQGIIVVMEAARLLGTEVILVGIRPEVAQAIVQLGLQLAGVRTFSTLQTALSNISNPHTDILTPLSVTASKA
jgi:rsbT co-antagonist protein RsbR